MLEGEDEMNEIELLNSVSDIFSENFRIVFNFLKIEKEKTFGIPTIHYVYRLLDDFDNEFEIPLEKFLTETFPHYKGNGTFVTGAGVDLYSEEYIENNGIIQKKILDNRLESISSTH